MESIKHSSPLLCVVENAVSPNCNNSFRFCDSAMYDCPEHAGAWTYSQRYRRSNSSRDEEIPLLYGTYDVDTPQLKFARYTRLVGISC